MTIQLKFICINVMQIDETHTNILLYCDVIYEKPNPTEKQNSNYYIPPQVFPFISVFLYFSYYCITYKTPSARFNDVK